MAITINATNHLNEGITLKVDRFPNICPACRRHIDAAFWGASLFSDNFRPLYAVFRCPVEQCRALFVSTYPISQAPASGATGGLLNNPPLFWTEEVGFAETVRKISPAFVVIYNQANQAEQNGLDQVAGPGYRKALEHLVKDFLIDVHANEEDKKKHILGSFLGDCIKNYVDDPRLKAVATRAAWLGNDESHYLRKWTDKDLQDLKNLISMTVNWIDLVLTSKEYISSMPE